MHLGRNITYECINACCVSQSVIHQVLNATDRNVKKEKFNGEIIITAKVITIAIIL